MPTPTTLLDLVIQDSHSSRPRDPRLACRTPADQHRAEADQASDGIPQSGLYRHALHDHRRSAFF